MLFARWRIVSVVLVAAVLCSCRTSSRTKARPPEPVLPTTPVFHFRVMNDSPAPDQVTVALDGKQIFSGACAFGQPNRFDLQVNPGWHSMDSRSGAGARHHAVVRGDREKWISVRLDPRKPEGFGVHITEYPTR